MDSVDEFLSNFPAWYAAGKQNPRIQSGIQKLGYCPYCGIDPQQLKSLYETLKERAEAKLKTGIRDKNGKEIKVGDILRSNGSDFFVERKDKRFRLVKQINGVPIPSHFQYDDQGNEIGEVVGNVGRGMR